MAITLQPETARPPSRAVQYLRMSTEHQRYSLENQAAAIAEYASLEGYDIVRTYADAGKSGLHLKGRRQLQQLLSDSLSPERDFDAILVLDVSRWGRFQDPDQAAYYEYICRGAGVRVAYVGETFENDGGLVSSIVKHLKRVMAAEYSRELSAKIIRAKLQQARLGFRQGGGPGYGFRRQLIRADGSARQVLGPGQFKAIHTERVTTVPGPPSEVAVIKRIFDLLIRHGTFHSVAAQLNAEGVFPETGRPWSDKRIAAIIRNELCVGTYTYGKTHRYLGEPTVRRPRRDWIRVPGGATIVPARLFARANQVADGKRYRYADRDLLNALRRHLKAHGRISPQMMKADPNLPHPRTYEDRFGSLQKACARIGYAYEPRSQWRCEIQGFWTKDTIIEAVRRCHADRGQVCAALLNSDPMLPSVGVVSKRFGGLIACYEAAGLPLSPEQVRFKVWKAQRPKPVVPDGLVLGPLLQTLLSD